MPQVAKNFPTFLSSGNITLMQRRINNDTTSASSMQRCIDAFPREATIPRLDLSDFSISEI